MSQPSYAPVKRLDKPVSYRQLRTPNLTGLERPAELRGPKAGKVPQLSGFPGPDQGYVLNFVKELISEVQLAEGENVNDVKWGLVLFALKRASLFGRAPVKKDLEAAANFFGFFSKEHDAEFLSKRKEILRGVSHSYERQREFAEQLPVDILSLGYELYKNLPEVSKLLSFSNPGLSE